MINLSSDLIIIREITYSFSIVRLRMNKDSRPIHAREKSNGWETLGVRGVETQTGHKEG